MAAAELTETFAGGVAPHRQTTGRAIKCLSYTVTTSTTGTDYITVGDLTTVTNAMAEVVATGVRNACTISTNEVTFTSSTTGAMRIVVWGY